MDKRAILVTTVIIIVPFLAIGQSLSSNEVKLKDYKPDPFKKYMYQHNPDNPCKDSLYVELKKMDLDEMSDRQFEIFKQKDKACQEYLKTVEATKPAKQNAETMEKANNAATTYYVIAGISLAVSTIFLFTI